MALLPELQWQTERWQTERWHGWKRPVLRSAGSARMC